MMATWSEIRDAAMTQLAEIAATGQSMGADGRILTHASIDGLTKLINMAEARIASAERTSRVVFYNVVPRT